MGTDVVTLRCGQVWQDDKGTLAVIHSLDESSFVGWVGVMQSHRIVHSEQTVDAFVYARKLVYDPAYAIPHRERAPNDVMVPRKVDPVVRVFKVGVGMVGKGYGQKPNPYRG